MKKHFILLSVELPKDGETDKATVWQSLQKRLAEKEKTTKDILKLADNVWLLERDSGMTFVAECIAVAEHNNLNPKARFLTEGD